MEKSTVNKESPAVFFSVFITIILLGYGFLLPSYFTDACKKCIEFRREISYFLFAVLSLGVSVGAYRYAVYGYQKSVLLNGDDKTITIERKMMFKDFVLKTYTAAEIDSLELYTAVTSSDGKIKIKFINGETTDVPCKIVEDSTLDFMGKANVFASAFEYRKPIKHFHDTDHGEGG